MFISVSSTYHVLAEMGHLPNIHKAWVKVTDKLKRKDYLHVLLSPQISGYISAGETTIDDSLTLFPWVKQLSVWYQVNYTGVHSL